jgi:hypothetical protein
MLTVTIPQRSKLSSSTKNAMTIPFFTLENTCGTFEQKKLEN